MTLKERAEALARVPVFAGLSRRSLERIARIAKDVELRPGQVLIEPRAKGSGMFVLLEGTVTASTRGRRARRLPQDPHRGAERGRPGAGDRRSAARLAALSCSPCCSRSRCTSPAPRGG